MSAFLNRGSSVEQTQEIIQSNLNRIVRDAINQSADGCLKNESTQDNTIKINAKDTVLSIDSAGLQKNGHTHHAAQIDHHQHLLINSRREANQLFAAALNTLSESDQKHAIRIMNLVKEQIYQEIRNKQELNFSSSPTDLKNSVAELRISEAKTLFAAQINNGQFMTQLNAFANNGMQVECKHKDADVVNYSP